MLQTLSGAPRRGHRTVVIGCFWGLSGVGSFVRNPRVLRGFGRGPGVAGQPGGAGLWSRWVLLGASGGLWGPLGASGGRWGHDRYPRAPRGTKKYCCPFLFFCVFCKGALSFCLALFWRPPQFPKGVLGAPLGSFVRGQGRTEGATVPS